MNNMAVSWRTSYMNYCNVPELQPRELQFDKVHLMSHAMGCKSGCRIGNASVKWIMVALRSFRKRGQSTLACLHHFCSVRADNPRSQNHARRAGGVTTAMREMPRPSTT